MEVFSKTKSLQIILDAVVPGDIWVVVQFGETVRIRACLSGMPQQTEGAQAAAARPQAAAEAGRSSLTLGGIAEAKP
jgi:hypothetical protein